MEKNGLDLLDKISIIGERNRSEPLIQKVSIFREYFDKRGQINEDHFGIREGVCTRREVLARYLLLNAVLDQGPDSDGVRLFLAETINRLYSEQIPILHSPEIFSKSLHKIIDIVIEVSNKVKKERGPIWASGDKTREKKYTVFVDSNQVLNYVVFRWGVPLSLPIILKSASDDPINPEPLLNY